MTGPVFVDTNVLVYDTADPVKQARVESWIASSIFVPGG